MHMNCYWNWNSNSSWNYNCHWNYYRILEHEQSLDVKLQIEH